MKRNPVSSQQNIWFDSQQVDNTDLTLEQDFNDTINSATISNHIGTGVIPEVLTQHVIFDSSIFVGLLDGFAISPQNQPTDANLGNQLEIELSQSKATITKSVKICLIGLDFSGNLQYETFYFKKNESQVSSKHFAKVLILLFNDFLGDENLSFNLGGRIVIREAKPMTLSRDAIMVAQDVEPNLFFRDFFLNGMTSLQTLLASALPFYNVDTLNIFTGIKDNKVLFAGDVNTQIGQKFIAYTNNIQKASLLLSVRNQELGNEDDLAWTGDLIVSIYPLQSGIECPTDIAPNLQIDFAPSNIPVAQLSFNYASLQASGVVLDSVPQPVDFIFSNSSPVASGNSLIVGNYYAITIKRSGSADKCDILIATGNNRLADSRLTTFTGTLWVDLPEDDLWFRIWTDAAKVSDGQAYESGHGIIIPKVKENDSLVTVDYSAENYQFFGNDNFYAVLFATTEESVPVADPRTGNPVLTRKQFVPEVSLLSTVDYNNLKKVLDPFSIGIITDKNKKFIDLLFNTINSKLYSATIIKDELLIRIVDDPTDSVRDDSAVTALTSALLNGNLSGAKLTPNLNNPSVFYKIGAASLCSMVVGDVNGDGIIDGEDLDILESYLGFNYNVGLPVDGYVSTDGYFTEFENGYRTYSNPFVSGLNITWQLIDLSDGEVIDSGIDGVLEIDPNDPRLAAFTAASIDFDSVAGIGDFKLVINQPSTPGNHGGFEIISVDGVTNSIVIRKILLSGETFEQLFRADIDGDFSISDNDGYILRSYLDRFALNSTPTPPSPGPTTNAYDKIGTKFNIIKIKLEKYIDRTDDYSSVTVGRSTTIHSAPDIFLADGYFAEHDFYGSPVGFSIQKLLTWDESLIISGSGARLVPTVFNAIQEEPISCQLEGVNCNNYPIRPEFDPGKINFFVPGDLILGGNFIRPAGELVRPDLEVGTIVFEIPDGYGIFNPEKTINIFSDFIFDYSGDGITRLGYPAMRFADCSFVKSDALSRGQIRFGVSVQSFSPQTNGVDEEDGYSGIIVDGKIGVYIDYASGLLTLNFANIFKDPVLRTLNTKIQIMVYLKKSGWLNQPIVINSQQLENLLNI